MKFMPSWSAIFDWDGVIIDSSAQHKKSWELLAEEEGRGLPDGHFKKGFGMKNESIIPGVLHWTGDPEEIDRLSERKEEIYRELLKKDGIKPLPGVRDFLEKLQAAGIPCVVGSSTLRINIETALDLTGLHRYFPNIISAKDVEHGKPNPEVFLKAAGRIGIPPERCVVFEDAHHGIEAALAAGMKAVGITSTHAKDTLEEAHRVVHSLEELSLEEIGQWFGA
jgi:beta-phosphoglucomutase family hydrolase